MGEKRTPAKARMELEELYLGIPDESVNLTFQDLAHIQVHHDQTRTNSTKKKQMMPCAASQTQRPAAAILSSSLDLDPISATVVDDGTSPGHRHNTTAVPMAMAKVPSLDLSRGLRASGLSHHHPLGHTPTTTTHVDHDHPYPRGLLIPHQYNHHLNAHDIPMDSVVNVGGHNQHTNMRRAMSSNNNSMAMTADSYEADLNETMSRVQASSGINYSIPNRSVMRQRRPGIPHSNICTVCSTYIYLFRHRCLVCGRTYCRHCVSIGMGEMTEGRKCIDCLGRRFSFRYIHEAGKMGCWSLCFGYGSKVKHEELKWAEKGPRKTGRSSMMMMSRSMSPIGSISPSGPLNPMGPKSPLHHSLHITNNPLSFVMSSSPGPGPYSSPSSHYHHHLPF